MKKLSKYKIYFALFLGIATVVLLFTFLNKEEKIGGWEEIEPKLAERFKDNEDLKKAAFQFGKTLQKTLESPVDQAKSLEPEFSRSINCVFYVAIQQESNNDKGLNTQVAMSTSGGSQTSNTNNSLDVIDEIRDISISTPAREKKYLEFNAALSGDMYSTREPQRSDCDFDLSLGN